MNEKDFKRTPDFLLSLYAIWYLINYYADWLDIQKVSEPSKIPVDVVIDEKGIIHLLCRFKMKKDHKFKRYYRLDPCVEEDNIFNEYLTFILQRNLVPLKPYQRGSNPENMLEYLYIEKINEYGKFHEINELDVIAVTSDTAYLHVENLILQRKRGFLS